MTHPITGWHDFVTSRDPAVLDAVLADDVVFRSPIVHTPQRGRAVTTMYLLAAMQVLGTDTFTYVREVCDGDDVVLEFTTTLDDTLVNGVDIIHFDDNGRIDDFTVMVRPLQAVDAVHQAMQALLERGAGTG